MRVFLLVFQGNEFLHWVGPGAIGFSWRPWVAGYSDPVPTAPAISVTVYVLLQGGAFRSSCPQRSWRLFSVDACQACRPGKPWGPYAWRWYPSFLLAPLAVGNGAAFVFGCRLLSGDSEQAPGRVYGLESAGALAGGVLFTFVLVGRFDPVEIALALGALNMVSLLVLLAGRDRDPGLPGEGSVTRRKAPGRLGVLCASLLAVFSGGLMVGAASSLYRGAMQLRWSPLELESTADSVFGNVSVLSLGGERTVYENGVPAMVLCRTPDKAALEEQVTSASAGPHQAPRDVLFLGGGAGGALGEALRHPVQRVVYTELDPLLIRTVARVDPRRCTAGTGRSPHREWFSRTAVLFCSPRTGALTLILIRLPDASTLQLNRFYTEDFFSLVTDHLGTGGIVAFTGLPDRKRISARNLGLLNRCLFDTAEQVFSSVRVLPGKRNLFLASKDVGS